MHLVTFKSSIIIAAKRQPLTPTHIEYNKTHLNETHLNETHRKKTHVINLTLGAGQMEH